jgi:SAM-dependent methyltransferase
MERHEAARINEAFWDQEVARGVSCTVPWLDLDRDALRQFVRGQLDPAPESLARRAHLPGIDLANVEGKDVLCLGAGGGQQSAVFGLLGARVTVVDLCEGQLDGDRRAAAHYGYDVTTVHADMQDLSSLDQESFDIVYATGLCYLPDARQVYAEIGRVLRPGGLLQIGFNQPAVQCVVGDETGYRIARPYCEKVDRREDGAVEFRHYMDDIFNGLLDAGLSLERVLDGHGNKPSAAAHVGSWTHQRDYVNGYFVIVARKPGPAS